MAPKSMTESIEIRKTQIRTKFRELRQGITRAESKRAGKLARQQLQQLHAYHSSQNIACFLSFDGELDTHPIIQQILADKSRCYLPKIKPLKPNRLWFMPYRGTEPLIKNKLGIDEVDAPISQAIRVSHIDIILLPLVAFDPQGNRLGMGGGYYDATLAHLSQSNLQPLCIGLAFEQQKVDRLPTEPWDFPLHGVLTQTQYYSFR